MRDLCAQFPAAYHRRIDEQRGYPEAFVDALTKAGWLAALIPQEFGGPGLSMAEASVIMEEINRSGGNSGACHGQMYVMNAIVFSGTQAQKEAHLLRSVRGELPVQSMGVNEPTTGSDTTTRPGAVDLSAVLREIEDARLEADERDRRRAATS